MDGSWNSLLHGTKGGARSHEVLRRDEKKYRTRLLRADTPAVAVCVKRRGAGAGECPPPVSECGTDGGDPSWQPMAVAHERSVEERFDDHLE